MILIARDSGNAKSPAGRFKVTFSPGGKKAAQVCSTLNSKPALHDFLVRVLKVDPPKADEALAQMERIGSARIPEKFQH